MLNPDIDPSHLPECIIGDMQKPTQTGTEIKAKLQMQEKKNIG